MIIDIFLTDITATFGMDKKEVTIDWLVFSNDIMEFPIAIAVQGTTDVMIAPPGHPLAGKALGWLQPGMPYSLGSEVWMNAYAGEAVISNRKIIAGKSGQRIDIANDQVLLVPQTPENTIVQWNVQQKFSTLYFDSEGQKVTVKFSMEMEEVPFVFDQIHGYPVMNSAGQLFRQLLKTVRWKLISTRRTRMRNTKKHEKFVENHHQSSIFTGNLCIFLKKHSCSFVPSS